MTLEDILHEIGNIQQMQFCALDLMRRGLTDEAGNAIGNAQDDLERIKRALIEARWKESAK